MASQYLAGSAWGERACLLQGPHSLSAPSPPKEGHRSDAIHLSWPFSCNYTAGRRSCCLPLCTLVACSGQHSTRLGLSAVRQELSVLQGLCRAFAGPLSWGQPLLYSMPSQTCTSPAGGQNNFHCQQHTCFGLHSYHSPPFWLSVLSSSWREQG